MKQLLLLLSFLCINCIRSKATLQYPQSRSEQTDQTEFVTSFNQDRSQTGMDDNTILNAGQPFDSSFRAAIQDQDTLLYWVVAFELLFSLIVFVKLGFDYLQSKQPYISPMPWH